MKLKSILTLAAAAILGLVPASPLTAADEHDHDHAAKAGPTGGKLLTEVEPHAEFLVTKDKKVEIRFVGEDNKVVAPAAQVVTVTLGERSKPTKLTFTKDGDKLVSDKTVLEGNDYPTVVEIKADAKAKPVRSRFNLNLTQCPTCAHPEYACTCEHGDHAKKDEAKKGKK
ncbi:MAG: hypothetical protein JWM59_2209 [Verrucomicrobiales bacterium]|nr:hypothetical protein [Verrucomicrobiales bacterium]